MAIFRGTIRSRALEMDTSLHIVLPEGGKARRTLVLLHGMKCNADSWTRMTCVERYAARHEVALVMPEVQHGYYTDMRMGLPYYSYVAEELPERLCEMYHIPLDRKRLFIGGFSMGGFGALKIALTRPDRYAGCLALSARCFVQEKINSVRHHPRQLGEMQAVFGCDLKPGPENDLLQLAGKTAAAGLMPHLYIACGQEDEFLGENQHLCSRLSALGYWMQYETWPGGHDWSFWDEGVKRGMEWLFDAEETAGEARPTML